MRKEYDYVEVNGACGLVMGCGWINAIKGETGGDPRDAMCCWLVVKQSAKPHPGINNALTLCWSITFTIEHPSSILKTIKHHEEFRSRKEDAIVNDEREGLGRPRPSKGRH